MLTGIPTISAFREGVSRTVTGRTRRWLHYEQTLNERIDRDPSGRLRILLCSHTVHADCRPERRAKWPLEVVWLPHDRVRTYGAVRVALRRALKQQVPRGCTPLLLHPQAPAAHRRLRDAYGSVALQGVWATPTSSFRSVVAWRTGRRPIVLKLSLGALVSGARRELREREVASGVIMSKLLETIPTADRQRFGFDWFPEVAGVVETSSGFGWLLRHLPPMMFEAGGGQIVPVFSLISRRGQNVPLVVEMIRRSGLEAEEFVMQKLARPYVTVLAYLLFEQGIQVEGHAQNVLFEMDENESLTGRIVLRDLSDMSVSIALRVAKQKPLPVFPRTFLPAAPPFPLASVAADHRCNEGRSSLRRARDTVERDGLRGFLWSVNTSLARFFPRYQAAAVERGYLALWREQGLRFLGLNLRLRRKPRGISTDESLAEFLRQVDWMRLGSAARASLPRNAEPLLIGGRSRRRPGAVYERVECAWGELFLDAGLPAFFCPAF